MSEWQGCYDDGWQGIIVPEAFAHPAKMAYGLTKRIFKHALSESWIRPGDVVVDTFGGIGSTGIIGASLGLHVVCVELEEKFVKLGKENFELNRKAFECSHFGHSYQPQIIQGDSRKLSEVIAGADCVVGSPPFCDNLPTGKFSDAAIESLKAKGHGPARGSTMGVTYGKTPGQLGAMKPGEVDAVVSSPPYEGIEVATGKASQAGIQDRKRRRADGTWEGYNKANPDNLGSNKGETFWQAARQIVSECHKILKPGGHAIWVVKAFVRKGAIVDFPSDWRRLCESQGFVTVHEHHAMLVKETRYNGLFGTITETKERKSFFRRLAEKKGSPKIDFEVVLCMTKE